MPDTTPDEAAVEALAEREALTKALFTHIDTNALGAVRDATALVSVLEVLAEDLLRSGVRKPPSGHRVVSEGPWAGKAVQDGHPERPYYPDGREDRSSSEGDGEGCPDDCICAGAPEFHTMPGRPDPIPAPPERPDWCEAVEELDRRLHRLTRIVAHALGGESPLRREVALQRLYDLAPGKGLHSCPVPGCDVLPDVIHEHSEPKTGGSYWDDPLNPSPAWRARWALHDTLSSQEEGGGQ